MSRLEDDLAKSKELQKKVYSKLVKRVKKLEDEVAELKQKRKAQIVSSSSSEHQDSNGDEYYSK